MFDPWLRNIPWKKKWQPTSVFLPGESHGQRSLEVYSPWGCKQLDMTEQLTTAFFLLSLQELRVSQEDRMIHRHLSLTAWTEMLSSPLGSMLTSLSSQVHLGFSSSGHSV